MIFMLMVGIVAVPFTRSISTKTVSQHATFSSLLHSGMRHFLHYYIHCTFDCCFVLSVKGLIMSVGVLGGSHLDSSNCGRLATSTIDVS